MEPCNQDVPSSRLSASHAGGFLSILVQRMPLIRRSFRKEKNQKLRKMLRQLGEPRQDRNLHREAQVSKDLGPKGFFVETKYIGLKKVPSLG